jgi:sialate O-acetylesterase
MFSDHGVLQRDQKIRVWGWASDSETVTVKLHGQVESTKADRSGVWQVMLAQEKAGGPYVLEIGNLKFKDIFVGDVWLAAGQSNMKYTVKGHPPGSVPSHAAELKASADVPMLRLLRVPQIAEDKPTGKEDKAWDVSTPATMEDFSLIGFLFGKAIVADEHVAVGIIEADYGGTPIEAWMSEQTYALKPGSLQAAMATYELFVTGKVVDPVEQPVSEASKAHAAGSLAKRAQDHPALAAAKNAAHHPSYLYNGMIAPLTGYGIKGVLWYQGESDAMPEQAVHYHDWLDAMIIDWRAKWHEGDFPFLVVQITSFNGGKQAQWGTVRQAEFDATKLPNVGLAVSYDWGNEKNPHPSEKEAVATRLVLAAKHIAYGANVEDSGPVFAGAKAQGSSLRASFTHATGMTSKGGGAVKGFEIAGSDGIFAPAMAVIQNDSVVLTAAAVPQPTQVRYAWANFTMDSTLVNGAGLPAPTFSAKIN